MTMGKGPLEGVRVIELATYIAAPAAGGVLAEWGADVIKVEPLAGCPMRGFMGAARPEAIEVDPTFAVDNRAKRFLALDVTAPAGREALMRLLGDADVLLTNLRPGALERAKLDYASLRGRFPKLVYASLTGFGWRGPGRDRPGFDITAFFARSGLSLASAPRGEAPLPPRTAMGDHVAGLAAAGGICAALLARARTGEGSMVDTSLQRSGIYAMSSDMSVQLTHGKITPIFRRGGLARNPLLSHFRTKDDRWLIIIPRLTSNAPGDWPGICAALEIDHAATDARFASHVARAKNLEILLDLLEPAFAAKTLAELAPRLDAQDLIWSEALTPEQATQDEQARAQGAFVRLEQQDGHSFDSPASPTRFRDAADGEYPPSVLPAPRALSADADATLLDAGYDAEAIAALREGGVIR